MLILLFSSPCSWHGPPLLPTYPILANAKPQFWWLSSLLTYCICAFPCRPAAGTGRPYFQLLQLYLQHYLPRPGDVPAGSGSGAASASGPAAAGSSQLLGERTPRRTVVCVVCR